MTTSEEKNPKKLKTDTDSDVEVEPSTYSNTRELELEKEILNTRNEAIYHDAFIEQQGKESILLKLNRPKQTNDLVILITDLPDEGLYKGYLCEIMMCYGTSMDPKDGQYEIVFRSSFDDTDRSRESKERYPDFEFPMTDNTAIVSDKDVVFFETQDLYYKTSFP